MELVGSQPRTAGLSSPRAKSVYSGMPNMLEERRPGKLLCTKYALGIVPWRHTATQAGD